MLISEDKLRSIVRKILLEEKQKQEEKKIQTFLKSTKEQLVKYYSNPAYKERVKNLFNKSSSKAEFSDKEIEQLVKDIISKIKVAKYKIVDKPTGEKDLHYHDYKGNAYLFFPAKTGEYKTRMTKIPVMILPKEVIHNKKMTDEILKDLIQHELTHIETLLKNDIRTIKGLQGNIPDQRSASPTSGALRDVLISDSELVEQLYNAPNRFENNDSRNAYISFYQKNLQVKGRYVANFGDQEVSGRLAQLRLHKNFTTLEDAIAFSRKNTFEKTKEKYGQFGAQLLFGIRTDIPIDKITKSLSVVASRDKVKTKNLV